MIYAIGDIHGQRDMLVEALAVIAADGGADAHIVFVGDYTDRGPDSRGVLDILIDGKIAGKNWTFLKGNHDRFFSHFVQFGRTHDPRVKSGINWLQPRLGGLKTLESYGVVGDTDAVFSHPDGELEQLIDLTINGESVSTESLQQIAAQAIPQTHLNFLDNLPLTYETDDLIFVHAGLKPRVALPDQDPEDLIWIRQGFIDNNHDFGKLIVHGHTALDHPQHFGNRVDLDGGAGFGRPLVPAVFEGRECWLLTGQGRVPLRP